MARGPGKASDAGRQKNHREKGEDGGQQDEQRHLPGVEFDVRRREEYVEPLLDRRHILSQWMRYPVRRHRRALRPQYDAAKEKAGRTAISEGLRRVDPFFTTHGGYL